MAKKIDINDVDYSRFLPTQDYVLAKRDEGEEKTESGVWYAKQQNKQTAPFGCLLEIGIMFFASSFAGPFWRGAGACFGLQKAMETYVFSGVLDMFQT